jgi:BlaI family penicillinase repressor
MHITAAESIVMDVLWRESPRTAEAIVADVADAQGWTEATVKTLINRLLKKKAIAADRDGRRYLYRPLLSRGKYVSAESRTLLDRFFDGRVSSMVSFFSESEKLSPKEIAELKRLIAELDK